jgi:hypothetical protein
MAQVLKYRVENAQNVTTTREVEFEGQPATVTTNRASIEAVPLDSSGPTFAMDLPAAALGDFPEGCEITVTVEVTAPPPPLELTEAAPEVDTIASADVGAVPADVTDTPAT